MMTNSKIWIISKREYLKIVTGRSFWAATLLFPLMMVVIMFISVTSQNQLEEKFTKATEEAKLILIVDQSKLIDVNSEVFKSQQIKLTDNFDSSFSMVKDGEADALIYFPADLRSKSTIEVYSKDEGILSISKYNAFATNLLKTNILNEIKDPEKIALYNSNLSFKEKFYKDGAEVDNSITKFIVPIVSIVLYFLFTSFATSYLLLSVSEEKENRMIEIILSSVKPRELIWGKVLGQIAVVLTQMTILILCSIVALKVASNSFPLPFDISAIQINPYQIALAVVYTLFGFIILANTMVGSGAAMPTYRDAQSFSTVFILLSIFPIYGVSFIIADPNGLIAYVLSYFPYSAPVILLLRNALGVLGPVEIILSILVMALYAYITGVLAYKLFEFGALEYNQKISFKNFFKFMTKR
jgi:ABC-2 type transport system permease protein